MHRSVRHAVALLGLISGGAPTLHAQRLLRPIDSVVVQEREGAYLGRIGIMTVGPRSRVYVSEAADAHVVEIAPNGAIAGSFGKKGNGPGEFAAPGSIAFIADSMFVMDISQRRVSAFNLRTRKFIRSFSVSVAGFAKLMAVGNQLLAIAIDPKAFTPVAVLSGSGAVVRTEGALPEFLHRNPMFVQTALEFPVAARGDDMWGATEYSQSLFRWRRGTTVSLEELKVPVVRRRGVDTDIYMQLLRDPSKATELLYNHSLPIALRFVAPDILALLTFDPTHDLKGQSFTGPHHLTLVDVRNKKVCPDFLVPIPTDPQPKVALTGDTLVVLQQASNSNGEVVSALRRFRIDPSQCAWVGMQVGRQ